MASRFAGDLHACAAGQAAAAAQRLAGRGREPGGHLWPRISRRRTSRPTPFPVPSPPAGLIGTTVYGGPASDPASPRIVKQASGAAAAAAAAAAAPHAASNPNSTNAPFAWPAMDASTAGTAAAPAALSVQAPQHSRSATVVAAGERPSGGGAAAPPAAERRAAPTSGDYLAALDSAATNPFETPALRQQEQQQEQAVAAAKAAAKQELLRQVRLRHVHVLLRWQVGVGPGNRPVCGAFAACRCRGPLPSLPARCRQGAAAEVLPPRRCR